MQYQWFGRRPSGDDKGRDRKRHERRMPTVLTIRQGERAHVERVDRCSRRARAAGCAWGGRMVRQWLKVWNRCRQHAQDAPRAVVEARVQAVVIEVVARALLRPAGPPFEHQRELLRDAVVDRVDRARLWFAVARLQVTVLPEEAMPI